MLNEIKIICRNIKNTGIKRLRNSLFTEIFSDHEIEI
jgi:hypothetical protein